MEVLWLIDMSSFVTRSRSKRAGRRSLHDLLAVVENFTILSRIGNVLFFVVLLKKRNRKVFDFSRWSSCCCVWASCWNGWRCCCCLGVRCQAARSLHACSPTLEGERVVFWSVFHVAFLVHSRNCTWSHRPKHSWEI